MLHSRSIPETGHVSFAISGSADDDVAVGNAPHSGETSVSKRAAPLTSIARQKQSNLLKVLVATRKAQHWSQAGIAAEIGVIASIIRKLEAGTGDVATLVAAMNAIPLHIAGIAKGGSLGEQLLNRREKLGMSRDAVAARASLSSEDVARLEAGKGSLQHLLRLLSVIAPTIRCRAPERAHWGQARKADRDSRFTTHEFMEPIYQSFGAVDLDPCAHVLSPVVAHRRIIHALGGDGLKEPWSGRLAYVNPPFSDQLTWLKRAYDQWAVGNVETVICLVPTRTDSQFFQRIVKPNADIFFLEGRVRFIRADGPPQATPFSLMLVVFGATVAQKKQYGLLVPGFWVPAGRHGFGGNADTSSGKRKATSACCCSHDQQIDPQGNFDVDKRQKAVRASGSRD